MLPYDVGTLMARKELGTNSTARFRCRIHMINILAVDDDERNLLVLHAVFDGEGYRLFDAHTLSEARHLLLSHIFNLVLLDLRLPDGNGLDIARQVAARHGIPVLVLSASLSPRDQQAAREVGCYGFLSKPLRLKTLQDAVKTALGQSGTSIPSECPLQPPAHTQGDALSSLQHPVEQPLSSLPRRRPRQR